jgi:hypothetical protein
MRSSCLTLEASNLLARGQQDAASAGSTRKMDAEAARRKARERKAEALGINQKRVPEEA